MLHDRGSRSFTSFKHDSKNYVEIRIPKSSELTKNLMSSNT